MKKLERLRKKELIEYITTIRPKADSYDRVCKQLGIENNILGFVKKLTIPDVSNLLKIMFKKRYTKWVALGNFNFSSYDYVTFIRKNLKNGLLQFKTKRVNGWFGVMDCTTPFIPTTLIDTQKVWDEVNSK